MDYYEILGVPRDADADQIKKAYRKLAMEYHPDRNQGSAEAEERFKELSEAYEVLKDPTRKASYDRYGKAGAAGPSAGGPFAGGFDLHDAIEIFMRDFGSGGFEEVFGRRGGGRSQRSSAGETLRVRLPVTLQEVVEGATKKIRIAVLDACETCGGTGSAEENGTETCSACGGRGEERVAQRSVFGQFVSVTTCRTCRGEGTIIRTPCGTCHGEGRARVQREIDVEVPPGVTSENYITLRGRGNIGMRGGPRGDVVALLEVESDPRFHREGRHLVVDVVVTFSQAALGAEIEVPAIEGAVAMKVPAGIQSGQAIRKRGRGFPELNSGKRGDLIARVRVWTPTDLSSAQRATFEKLRESEDEAPEDVHSDGEDGGGFWSKVREAFSSP